MSLRAALAFLTVLPLAGPNQPEASLGRAWFPLVGGGLGLAAGGTFYGLSLITTPLLAAVGAVATLAVLSGGLHLDGLADCADGLLGGRDREHRLEIMRDSRLGAFGATALVLTLQATVVALAGMAPTQGLIALVLAGTLSRWGMLGLVAWLPYARSEGLGSSAGGRPVELVLATVLTGTILLLLDWRAGLLATAAAVLAVALVGLGARARIGGATGDVYGASCELAQLFTLVILSCHRG